MAIPKDYDDIVEGYYQCAINCSCLLCPYNGEDDCLDHMRDDVYDILKKYGKFLQPTLEEQPMLHGIDPVKDDDSTFEDKLERIADILKEPKHD